VRVASKSELVREIRRQRCVLGTFKWLIKTEQATVEFWRNRYNFLHLKSSREPRDESMTEDQRYAKLRELLPFAQGATVDELIESQAKFNTQKVYLHQQALKPLTQEQSTGERTWQTQRLSPRGATTQQVPPGDNPSLFQ